MPASSKCDVQVWAVREGPRLVQCRPVGEGWDWSGQLPVDEIGEACFALSCTGKLSIWEVTTRLARAAFTVTFRKTADAPFSLRNRTATSIWVQQEVPSGVAPVVKLEPQQEVPFAWSEPTSQHSLVLRFGSGGTVVTESARARAHSYILS